MSWPNFHHSLVGREQRRLDYPTFELGGMSNTPEPNPAQPSGPPPTGTRWSHLNQYERKYLKEAMRAYDQIVELTDDVPAIARPYQLSADDVQRAKDYAFGSGVSRYEFSPDLRMAEAWTRMASGQGTDIDEVLLRHEGFESDLVVNQGMNQPDAHQLPQERYPWSVLIMRENP